MPYLLGFEEHYPIRGLIFIALATMAMVNGWRFTFVAFVAWGYKNPQA